MKLRLFTIAFAALVAAPSVGFALEQLSAGDVQVILSQAVTRAAQIDPKAIVAVTDREGFLLGLWNVGNPEVPYILPPFPATAFPNLTPDEIATTKLYALVGAAITRASAAAFLSSAGEAFSSRTAGYIIQQHFPVGIVDTPPGPLVGVGFSSLFFTDVNRVKLIPPGFDGAALVSPTTSPGVNAPLYPLTSLDDSPGGLPLFKNGKCVGGVGVTGDGHPTNLLPAGAIFFKQVHSNATSGFESGPDTDEDVAIGGQTGFRPPDFITANNVFLGGIRIPYTNSTFSPPDVSNPVPLGQIGHQIDVPIISGFITAITVKGSTTVQAKSGTAGLSGGLILLGAHGFLQPDTGIVSVVNGNTFTINKPALVTGTSILTTYGPLATGAPQAAPAPYPYEPAVLGGYPGEIRVPFRDDPLSLVPGRETIGGAKRLTAADVKMIITNSAQRAHGTRAGIRNPVGGPAAVFITVSNNPDKAGESPVLLGIFGTQDATIFSLDVAVQKGRTALFFSNHQLAMSCTAVGFIAQRFFPPGIDGTQPGPLFGFQEAVSLKTRPYSELMPGQLPFPGNTNLPNGITIFPGGFPLYRDGQVIGAVGVSGDGVTQDDIISSSGTQGFEAPPNIRADSFSYRGARLPYAKYPRDPAQ